MREGKPVPQEVLNDYPELVRRLERNADAELPREKRRLTTWLNRLKRGEWFAKSRDFESFIDNLGFDLDSEADLNLAYDLMEGG